VSTQTNPVMQRREAYMDGGRTTRCSPGLNLTDHDSSRPVRVSGRSAYIGDALCGGLATLDDNEDHPWLDQHQRQQSAAVDVDYCQYYDHAATVLRSGDVRRRRTNSNDRMTWNDFKNTDCYSDRVSSWPDNGYTAFCV